MGVAWGVRTVVVLIPKHNFVAGGEVVVTIRALVGMGMDFGQISLAIGQGITG